MHEDSGSVVPAQVEKPDDFGYEQPTAAALLTIFLMPDSKRRRIAALAKRLRRGVYRARAKRDHR